MAKEIALSNIEVGEDRARKLEMDWAEVIAESVAEQGLLNNITVRPVDGGYKLVTGLHRLEAHRILERKTIRCNIRDYKEGDEHHYRLEEITENVIRNELTALDRARALYELDQIYKSLYPELKHGGDRKSEEAKNQSAINALRSELLEKVGLSKRAFYLATAIWRGLSKQSKARIYGTWLAKHQAGLVSLADQTPANQKKVLDILFPAKGEARASNMPDALYILEHGRLLDSRESRFDRVLKVTRALKPKELEMVFEAHEKEIMAWVKARSKV